MATQVGAADVVDFGSRIPSADEFEAALRPAPALGSGVRSRGIRPIQPTVDLEEDPGPSAHSTLDEDKRVQPGADLKAISMEIQFDYDSARLSESSLRLLKNLGTAIERPGLSNYRFRIDGHTDSKGSASYNQRLSERRADSVRSFLLANFGIPARRLEAVGQGEGSPRAGRAPEDPANRRVEIVTLEGGQSP
jgi:outer membrane protein OmpA-like peptidoglycan-associated protein